MEHPTLVDAIQKTIAACQQHNVCPIIHLGDPKLAAACRRGMRMISTGSEISFIMRAGRESIAAIRGRTGRMDCQSVL
jgi:2-keto-3-deoxy-L-rhamnonate aldolase RhmA